MNVSYIPVLDIDWLRANHTHLHPFGLGFLQMKLNENERMHFWHPGFKREREEVHDHRYEFTSTIMRGEMRQELYRFVNWGQNATHQLFHVTCEPGHAGEDVLLGEGYLQHIFSGILVEGVTYRLDPETLHRIDAEKCVTHLRRNEKTKRLAKVAREIGASSSCPFAESVPESEMWAMIEDCLR